MSLLEKASLIVTPNAYKESKLYSVVPSDGAGDMDVVRATTATRVNSAGLIESVAVNVPRIDYTNGSCPSLLVEPQRTNLVTYSDNVPTADVNLSTYILDSSVLTPANTNNAYKFTPYILGASIIGADAPPENRLWFQINTTNTTFTNSVYVKSVSGSNFNLAIKVVNAFSDTEISSTTINVNNNWQRVSVSGLTTGPSGGVRFVLKSEQSVHLWGFQVEQGSYATSYIPTVASTVTRNADVISKTGISSLIGQTEGTLFMDCKINALPLDGSFFGIQKTSSSFVIRFGSDGNVIYAQSYNGSANLFFETFSYTLGNRIKAAFAYKAGSYAFYINGVQIATGSNATAIPNCDETMFNSLWGNFNDSGSVSFYSNTLWKTRLSNTELAQLTTL